MTSISIITVCHKSSGTIEEYVSSFLRVHQNSNWAVEAIEFVFVENSCDDAIFESIRPLQDSGFKIQLVTMDNLGFGAGCNKGAQIASNDVLLFVNPDVVFKGSLFEIYNSESDYGWATCCQVGRGGKKYFIDILPEYRNVFTEVFKIYRFINLVSLVIPKFMYAVGSFLLVEKRLFSDVCGFDERFFLYYEEADLCRRLFAKRSSSKIFNNIVVYHEGFGSSSDHEKITGYEVQGFKQYLTVINRLDLVGSSLRRARLMALFSDYARVRYKKLLQCFGG